MLRSNKMDTFLIYSDCKEQLQASMATIQENGGIVIYLQQEGRGIGIANKVAAYSLQDGGADTVEANRMLGLPDEMREYFAVPDILADMKIESIRLMTNNPYKVKTLSDIGVKIVERVPIEMEPNDFNIKYLKIKRDKMNHYLKTHFDQQAVPEISDERGRKKLKTDSNRFWDIRVYTCV